MMGRGYAMLAAFVLAHIPQPLFLLDKMAEQRDKMGVTRLKVSMQCGDGISTAHEETLYLKAGGLVRRERGGGKIELCGGGKCWVKGESGKLPSWTYLPWLYFVESPQGSRYLDLLHSLNINTKVDTISRAHGRVAFVLGAKHWEQDRPQFYLDKDRFLPLKLMLMDGKSLLDIRWIDWGTKIGGDWFPAVLEIRRDAKVLERCEVTEVKSGESMPEELFKP